MSKPIRSWFRMRADAASGVGTINILGDIGGYGQDFKTFSAALDNMGIGADGEIKVTINSDGGDVSQGFAIYNALAMHPAKKTVTVMGLAASMASVVAMAGDVRNMPKNAVMMIHNPVGGIQGESEEIISFGEAVGDMRDNIAQTYSDASGGKLTKAKALALMDKQSWLGAQECLALGLCTNVIEPMKMAASFVRNADAANWKCGASRGLTVDDTTSWDGPAAASKMLDDAGIGGDNPNVTKAKRGFLAYDASAPNLRGSYKLPFAILSGGTLKASKAGIRAAASRLPQTDIPQSVKDTARNVLDSYESKAKPNGQHKESAMTTKTNNDAEMFEGEDDATVQAARADERKRILAQQKEVNALCRVGGRPELAAKFNEDGKSVSEVVAELDKLGPVPKGKTTRNDKTGEVEISARAAVDTGDDVPPMIDTAKIYADYNAPGAITRRAMARAN